MDSKVATALEVLQEAAVSRDTNPASWLDEHREHVEVLLEAKGPTMTAELLGLKPSTLNTWRRRRGLVDDYHTAIKKRDQRMREEGGRRRAQAQATSALTDASYWKARAEALWDVLVLLVQSGADNTVRTPQDDSRGLSQ